jgi:hypothetical protein
LVDRDQYQPTIKVSISISRRMSPSGRFLPIRIQLLNVREQYIPDLQVKILNDRNGADTGHPTKLLGYSPRKGRKNLNLPFNVHPLDVVFAA